MSTRSSIFYHHDPAHRVHLHIYEELLGEHPLDIRLEVEFEHGTINVPWPVGLSQDAVLKLAIEPRENDSVDQGHPFSFRKDERES